MKAYTAKNYLTTLDFIKHILEFCSNKDFEIITDKMPCYKQVCKRLGIRHKHVTFGKLCVNLRKILLKMDKSYWFRRALYLLGLWLNMFMFYWNEVRG